MGVKGWKEDRHRRGQLPLYQFFYRLYNSISPKHIILRYIIKKIYILFEFPYGCEIHPSCVIGPGLYLGHPWNITINGKAIIGSNCNIHKGVTIGQESRGKRKGAPEIGSSVWIGVNSTIVGKIVIGDDVMIAPNSYVNCDVPSHSIVIGNPCIIHHRDNAIEEYVNNRI